MDNGPVEVLGPMLASRHVGLLMRNPARRVVALKLHCPFDSMHHSVSAEILSFPPGELPTINEGVLL